MKVQDVDKVRLQLGKRVSHAHKHAALVGAAAVGRLVLAHRVRAVVGRVLGREDKLVPISTRRHPLAQPRLALLILLGGQPRSGALRETRPSWYTPGSCWPCQ